MVTDENTVSDSKEEVPPKNNTDAEQLATSDSGEQKESGSSSDENVALNEELKKLKDQLEQAQAKAEKHWEELLRSKAELENTRKRLERDVENAHKYAAEKFIQDLLPVIDSLEMGVSAANEIDADIHKVKEGTELTLKMFSDCAGKFGVEAVDPIGQPFDPELHQAMTMQESSEHEPNTVIAVMQKGYLLNGRLVRPAMVVVSKAPQDATGETVVNKTENEQENQSDKANN